MRSPLAVWARRFVVDARRRAAGMAVGPTRRSLLAGLGAAPVALGCASGAVSGREGSRTEKVVVLGAGLAGLNAARLLVREGFAVRVVEALDRPGGRVYSAPGLFASAPDRVAELGGEWINSSDTDLLDLVTALGLPLIDLYASELDELIWLEGGPVAAREVARALEPLVAAIDRAVAGLPSDEISYASPAGAEELDHTSVADWMRPYTEGTLADPFMRQFMTTDFGREVEEQSALNLLFYMGSGAVEYDERYRILGGNQQVADALAERLGDRLRYGVAAVAIREADGGRLRVEYADGSDEIADHVVSALPFSVLRTLALDVRLADVKRRAIQELGYGTNAKLLLPFTGRPWREAGQNGLVLTDGELQSGWDQWDQQEGEAGAFANFTGGAHGATLGEGSADTRAAELVDGLERFWPGSRAQWTGEVARQAWPGVPTALGSYSCYLVGQWTSLGGAEPEAAGRLHFCGEHTSYDFQGYMNGAAESGRRVAEELIAEASGAERTARKPRACRRRPWRRPR